MIHRADNRDLAVKSAGFEAALAQTLGGSAFGESSVVHVGVVSVDPSEVGMHSTRSSISLDHDLESGFSKQLRVVAVNGKNESDL